MKTKINPCQFALRKLKQLILYTNILFISTTSALSQWSVKQTLPSTPRYAAPSFTIGNIGYIIGGESSIGTLTDAWSYNPTTNNWSQVASFPGQSRVKPVAFAINGLGYYGLGADSTLYSYNPVSNSWAQLTSPPFIGLSYWSSMYFTIGNDAYFLLANSNTVLKFNTTNNSWSQLSNFPGTTRATGSGFSINGKGYVTCGVNSFGNPYLNDLWEYNPVNDSWNQLTSLPGTGRYATLAVSLNGKGYLIGGERYSPNITLNEFWQYDPTTDNWIQLPNFLGGTRNYLTGFPIGNTIYCGFGGFGYNSDFYAYTECIQPPPVSLGTNNTTELCPNEQVTIKVVTPVVDPSLTYQWTRNGTNMTGATTRSITVNDAAKYKVFVRSGPGVNCQRVSGLVETTAATPPTITATAPNGTALCPGDSVLMTASGATAGYSYRWKRFGVVIAGANSNTFYATQTGNYRCEVYNAGGCITQSNLITISNGTSCRVMGEMDSDVSVYPNPAQNNFTVSFNDIGNEIPVSISLRNLQGQVIETRAVTTTENAQFSVAKLAPGMYMVSIQLESGDTIEKTVVVK